MLWILLEWLKTGTFLSLFIVFVNLILLLVVYEGRELMGLESDDQSYQTFVALKLGFSFFFFFF